MEIEIKIEIERERERESTSLVVRRGADRERLVVRRGGIEGPAAGRASPSRASSSSLKRA